MVGRIKYSWFSEKTIPFFRSDSIKYVVFFTVTATNPAKKPTIRLII